MERTLANIWVKGRYWWILGLAVTGVVLAEILYFHVFELQGIIATLFSIEDKISSQGWWNDERKGVWIVGALWGVGVASKIVLKWR